MASSNVLSYTVMSGNSAIQISGATLEAGGTVTFGGIPLTIVSVSGDTAVLTGVFSPAPVANLDIVTVAGAAPAGPSAVTKKFVQQNDGALNGSLTDLRATSIEVAAGGNIDMGGNQIHNVAEGTAQDDVVVVSQLSAAVSGITSDIDMVATDLTTEVDRATGAEVSLGLALSSEASRAIAAEDSLNSALASEISRAQSAEVSAYQAAADYAEQLVVNEASSREAGDTSIVTVMNAADEALASQISTEIANRATAVSNEAVLRLDADASLTTRLSTEKARVDAILLAAGADKDSFAEIVSLINSVDTTNDTAFANYVLSNNAALSIEVSRAGAAEVLLNSALSSEISRATATEQAIAANLSSEIIARASDVDAEETRAIAAEVSLTTRLSGEESTRLAKDNSLVTAISTEKNRAEIAELSLETAISNEESRAMATEAALDSNKYDKTGGLISGNVWVSNNVNVSGSMVVADGFSAGGWTELPGVTFDPAGPINFAPTNGFMSIDVVQGELSVSGNLTINGGTLTAGPANFDGNVDVSGEMQMQSGMQVTGSAQFGGDVVMGGVNVKPVVTVVETSGAGDYEDISTMFGDLASFTGMVMANFQVVADGGGKGMAGEYRISAQCNGGQLLILSVVELAQDLLGGAYLDVDFLTDGKVRVINGANESGTFKWHVQRVKMVAVNTSGAVK